MNYPLSKPIGYRRNGKPIFPIRGGAPTPRELMESRLAELRTESDNLLNQRGAIIDAAAAEKRGFTDAEQASYDELGTKRAAKLAETKPVEERIAELVELEKRDKAAADARVQYGQTGDTKAVGSGQVTDPDVYIRSGRNGNSYFRDLANRHDNPEAADRLRRYAAASADKEKRALGNTNTTGGSGGEFAPPTWLVEDYIKLARPGRVTADLFQHSEVPVGTSSLSIPRIITGTTVALQGTQNTALSQTDLTTGSVTTGFSTVGGKQVVSQQLLDQSAINFDQVITSDLAAAYAQNLGFQVIYGAGTGANDNSVMNGLSNATINGAQALTFTSGSPTAALFWSKTAGMLSAFVTARYAQPDTWLMHPRRFYWLLAQVDSQGRPLVVPTPSDAVNAMGTDSATVTAAGYTGLTYQGLPVFIDPQLPTTLGAGNNQDEVFLLKRDDLWLFESPVVAEVFRETYSDSMGVLFRLYAYAGTILNRYSTSIATMNGTGLVAPSF